MLDFFLTNIQRSLHLFDVPIIVIRLSQFHDCLEVATKIIQGKGQVVEHGSWPTHMANTSILLFSMGMNGPPLHPHGPNVFAWGSIAFSWTSASGSGGRQTNKGPLQLSTRQVVFTLSQKKNRSFFPLFSPF